MSKLFINDMPSTVFTFSLDGIDINDEIALNNKIGKKVEAKVKLIIDQLKLTHSKFEDPDFGPNDADEYGAKSLYNGQMPVGYPPPQNLKWDRPVYDDKVFGNNNSSSSSGKNDGEEEEEEEEDDEEEFDEFSASNSPSVFCDHGQLFIDGGSSGDVVQGQLGDCWYLSALAVLAQHDKLLKACFWNLDNFKDFGLFVCRFYKDHQMMFVVIDDRIPCKAKDGTVVFAQCKDPNELWVPLIEKAYAKLHGSYKALISGFSHYALGDLTGFSPRLIVFKRGHIGYSESFEVGRKDDNLWTSLVKYSRWNCLMGSSIQPNPSEKGHSTESDAGSGLYHGHAYSLLEVGTINVEDADAIGKTKTERLLKLRNPWGRGEWTGAYSDESIERLKYDEQIKKVFALEASSINGTDGTFFMTFKDWMEHFTSLFVAVNFPQGSGPDRWYGQRKQGVWNGEQGGNRQMGTWSSNPKVSLYIEGKNGSGENQEYAEVFVGLYIKDTRLSLGIDYNKDPLYATPLAFDIVTAEELAKVSKEREYIPNSLSNKSVTSDHVKQPPYVYGTTQVEVLLKTNVTYYIIPSLYKRGQSGTYFLNVFSEVKLTLEGGIHITSLINSSQGNVTVSDANATIAGAAVTNAFDTASINSTIEESNQQKRLISSTFDNEKRERLRERIIVACKRLNITMQSLEAIFHPLMIQPNVTTTATITATDKTVLPTLQIQYFKRKLIDAGFSLADFPDDDISLLATTNDDNRNEGKVIGIHDFLLFVKDGFTFHEQLAIQPPPPPPVDDLIYKAADLAGDITAMVYCGRNLRKPTTWFNAPTRSADGKDVDAACDASELSTVKSSTVLKYDKDKANESIRDVEAAYTNEMDKLYKYGIKHASTVAANAVSSKALDDKLPFDDYKSELKSMKGTNYYNRDDPKSMAPSELSTRRTAAEKLIIHEDEKLTQAERHRNEALKKLKYQKKANAARDSKVTALASTLDEETALRKAARATKKDGRRLESDHTVIALLGRQNVNLALKCFGREPLKDADVNVAFTIAESVVNSKVIKIQSIVGGNAIKVGDYIGGTGYIASASLSGNVTGYEEKKSARKYAGAVYVTQVMGNKVTVGSDVVTTEAFVNDSIELSQHVTIVADGTSLTVLSNVGKIYYDSNGVRKKLSDVYPLSLDDAAYADSSRQIASRSVDVIAISSSHDALPDLWDYLIECVITIATSKSIKQKAGSSKFTQLGNTSTNSISNNRYIKSLKFTEFDPVPSSIPTPINIDDKKVARSASGSVNVNPRKRPGTASVTDNMSKYRTGAGVDAKEVSKHLESVAESQKLEYVEVYRRLVLVPRTNFNEIEGDLSASNHLSNNDIGNLLQRMFDKIDVNHDGIICIDEFRKSLMEMNIDMSDEECQTLFNRFETRKKDGFIDVVEFFEFFNNRAQDGGLAAAVGAPSNAKDGDQVLLHFLQNIKTALQDCIASMTERRCNSLEMLRDTNVTTASSSSDTSSPFVLPESAIFSHFDDHHALKNMSILQSVGVQSITVPLMQRIQRIFSYSVHAFMEFVTKDSGSSLVSAMYAAEHELISIFHRRSGLSSVGATSDGNNQASSSVNKLWTTMAPSLSDCLQYEDAVTIFNAALCDIKIADDVTGTKTALAPAAPTIPTTTAGVVGATTVGDGKRDTVYQIQGVSVNVLSRLIVDKIIASIWNRDSTQIDGRPPSLLSLSGLEAFLRNSHVDLIERKFRYIIQSQLNNYYGSVFIFIRVFFSLSKQKIMVVGLDSLTSELYKLSISEDVGMMPMDKELEKLFQHKKDYISNYVRRCIKYKLPLGTGKQWPNNWSDVSRDSCCLYNPHDTPMEDSCIGELVTRIRIVQGRELAPAFILAEDPKFVDKLSLVIKSCQGFPFFTIVNDLHLSFAVDKYAMHETKSTSISNFVFTAIRKHKVVYNFLTNTLSDLKVVLSSYNGGTRISMSWLDMLAHLNEYRNPFVCAKLLPDHLEVKEYLYRIKDNLHAFNGEEESSNSERGPTDSDGGTHPTWDYAFNFEFSPPKITTCKILSSDITKVKLDGVDKYVIIMVRETQQHINEIDDVVSTDRKMLPLRFLTLYDSRTATDFQCGVKADGDCELYKLLYTDRMRNSSSTITQINDALSKAIDADALLIGPAITPRLMLSVYNDRKGAVEMLGVAQISISSLLSSVGENKPFWVKLNHSVECDEKSIDIYAGELKIEMSYCTNERKFAKEKSLHDVMARKSKANQTATTAVITRTEQVTAAVPKTIKNERVVSDSVTSQLDDLKQSVIQLTKEKDSLAAADKAVVAELVESKAKLAALAQEKEELRRQVQATSTVTPVAAISVAQSEEYIELQKQYTELKNQAEQLKKSHNEMLAKTTTAAAAAVAVPTVATTPPTTSKKDAVVDGSIVSIITCFNSRYTSDILGPFTRLLRSYADGGKVTAADVRNCLNDLLIPVTIESADDIINKCETQPPNVTDVVMYMQKICKKLKYVNFTPLKNVDIAPPTIVSVPLVTTTPSVTVTTATVPLVTATPTITGNTKPGSTLPIPPTPPAVKEMIVDWDSAPLPDGWERCYDNNSSRTYYKDHKRQLTQWNHPNDLEGSQSVMFKRKKKEAKKTKKSDV